MQNAAPVVRGRVLLRPGKAAERTVQLPMDQGGEVADGRDQGGEGDQGLGAGPDIAHQLLQGLPGSGVVRVLFHDGQFAAGGRRVGEVVEPGPDRAQRGGQSGALAKLAGGEWAPTGDAADMQFGQRGLPEAEG
jgi:hypothetical protein